MIEPNPEESRARERAEAEFIANVAGPLRAPESLDPTFEQRLMSAVHAEVRSRALGKPFPWWRRGRTVRLSPLAMLAMAASLVGIFVAGAGAALLTRRPEIVRPLSISREDTVRVVRFIFVDSAARSVSIVGDFNRWTKGATQLLPTGHRGTWVVSVPLTLGRHEYAFIIDGTRWVADPFAITLHDDFGTESSVVMLTKQG
jgi:hypothetical protein